MSISRFITNRARLTCMFSTALTAILVVFAYWNIWAFVHKVANFPPRQSNDLVVSEERYRPIKFALINAGYKHGPIGFLTRREIKGEKLTDQDHVHRVISQCDSSVDHVVRSQTCNGSRIQRRPAFRYRRFLGW